MGTTIMIIAGVALIACVGLVIGNAIIERKREEIKNLRDKQESIRIEKIKKELEPEVRAEIKEELEAAEKAKYSKKAVKENEDENAKTF